jgi:hypothetical protein
VEARTPVTGNEINSCGETLAWRICLRAIWHQIVDHSEPGGDSDEGINATRVMVNFPKGPRLNSGPGKQRLAYLDSKNLVVYARKGLRSPPFRETADILDNLSFRTLVQSRVRNKTNQDAHIRDRQLQTSNAFRGNCTAPRSWYQTVGRFGDGPARSY